MFDMMMTSSISCQHIESDIDFFFCLCRFGSIYCEFIFPNMMAVQQNARLLLLSNSTMAMQPYLQWPKNLIKDFLNVSNVKEILFIPFAGVKIEWDDYSNKVKQALEDDFKVKPIHHCTNYEEAVQNAEAIMIGGGNTFHLLYKLYEYNLLELIRKRILDPIKPIPYIGWSAGSNVAGPDIGTTNDMPIIWPPSDRALNLIPYNLNPHYNEWQPPNLKGETRMDRLNECVLIKKRPIVAYSEGVAIRIEHGQHRIIAPKFDDLNCFFENKDNRTVKVWTFENDKIQINEIPLDDSATLNAYVK
uniref:Uncharacterized protein LOC113793319 n=1 Tax=Dermatophagoides pteronyssinus TaxID=6956 RepID=A0A6P6Y0Y8_DERPT|nr:uncharacterized protein LOC113793319 [Dermatophagoides pteronyssinus]